MLPEPYDFKVAWSEDGIHETERNHSAFLPHETMAKLSRFPEIFAILFGTVAQLTTFWEKTAQSHWFQRHPLQDVINASKELFVPLGIHGDDADTFQGRKVLVLNWGSVAVQLSTLDSRILFSAVALLHAVKGKTIETIYRVWVWSINCMASGEHPWEDHDGIPFSQNHHPERFKMAGKKLTSGCHCAVFSELRGDWKWQWEALYLEQFYSADEICHLCRAHKKRKRLYYTQFRRDAHLRKTIVSWPQFRDWLIANPHLRSPLTWIIGFSTWRCWVDAMHNLDLGIYQSIAAGCLVELVCENVWPAANKN